MRSKYEARRVDPASWKLGVIYYNPHDPRIVVRQLLPAGWACNFAYPRVVPAILLTLAASLAPPAVAWWLGVRSWVVLGLMAGVALCAIMVAASRLARDPES